MSATNLSSQLQDYLNKSGSSNSLSSKNSSNPLMQGFNSINIDSVFGIFKSQKEQQQELSPDETINGWFNQAQQDPFLPTLSKKQRVLGFVTLLLLGSFCLSLASMYLPFLLLKSRKFAVLYTFGTLFLILSFSMLWGPMNHMKHLFSPPRLAFSSLYVLSMVLTLFFALSVHSVILTAIFSVLQMAVLVCYLVSYIPGGLRGLKFFTRIFYVAASKTVHKSLPV